MERRAPAWDTVLDTAATAIVGLALAEDRVSDDISSAVAFDQPVAVDAEIVARQHLVVAGMRLPALVVQAAGVDVAFNPMCEDGSRIGENAVMARLHGPARAILSLERTILNLLQRMCGIATFTRVFVDAVAGTGAQIVDTRKTTPGWRLLEKYAVRCGGGLNHRFNLSDMFMFKDNHLALAVKDIGQLVAQARAFRPGVPIACEAESLDEVKQLVEAKVDILMLDNMSPTMVGDAVALARGTTVIEVTGGVNLRNARVYAELGIDRISIGALTHSAPAADIALDVCRTD